MGCALGTDCGLTAGYCELLRTQCPNPQLVSQSVISQQSAMPLVGNPKSAVTPFPNPGLCVYMLSPTRSPECFCVE
jgi:hypothetical protein